MQTLPYAQPAERRIVKAIVADALAKNWKISVNDGEEWVIKQSRDQEAILQAMGATDMDILLIRDQDGERVGSISLVWGNGEDLLSDHSDNGAMAEFCSNPRYN